MNNNLKNNHFSYILPIIQTDKIYSPVLELYVFALLLSLTDTMMATVELRGSPGPPVSTNEG